MKLVQLKKQKIEVLSKISLIKKGDILSLKMDNKEIIKSLDNKIIITKLKEILANNTILLQFQKKVINKTNITINYVLVLKSDLILKRVIIKNNKNFKNSIKENLEILSQNNTLNDDNNILTHNKDIIKTLVSQNNTIITANYDNLVDNFKKVTADIKSLKAEVIKIHGDNFKISKKFISSTLANKYNLDTKLDTQLATLYINLLEYKLQNNFDIKLSKIDYKSFNKIMNLYYDIKLYNIENVNYSAFNTDDLKVFNIEYNKINKIITDIKLAKKGYIKADTIENKNEKVA